MKKVLLSLFALALLCSQTWGSNVLIDPYSLSSGAPPPPASISYVTSTQDSTDQQAYTLNGISTGTAGNRWTGMAVCGSDGSGTDFSVSSVTVDGNAASELVDTADAGSQVQCAIYVIANPTGTTANFVVTFSEAIVEMSLSVWAIYDLASITPNPTPTSQFQTSGANVVLSMTLPANSVVMGVSASNNAANTTTWVGLTERVDASGGSQMRYSAADTTSVAGGALTIGSDHINTADTIGAAAALQ